jgi:hypothetical protein
MSKAKATSTIASKPRPTGILVMYGYDENQKPRAAKFAEPEIALARKAADFMKLSFFETDAPKLRRKLKKSCRSATFTPVDGDSCRTFDAPNSIAFSK